MGCWWKVNIRVTLRQLLPPACDELINTLRVSGLGVIEGGNWESFCSNETIFFPPDLNFFSLSAFRGHQLSKSGHWNLHWHGKLSLRSSALWWPVCSVNNTVCVCLSVCVCWSQGRFTIAAKHHITIAEIYESELVDIEKVRQEGEDLVKFSMFFFRWNQTDLQNSFELLTMLLIFRPLPTMSRQQTTIKERNQTGMLHLIWTDKWKKNLCINCNYFNYIIDICIQVCFTNILFFLSIVMFH